MSEQAERHNIGKTRYSLIDIDAMEGLAQVLTYGAEKYAPNNWRKGLPFEQVVDSLMRHLAAFRAGEDFDPESGCRHIDHVACNVMFLQSFNRYAFYKRFDDRQGLDSQAIL